MKQYRIRTIALLTACAILTASAKQATAATRFVDANPNVPGPRDGSSWDNAYEFLQDALDVAQALDEIHIADGIYHPDDGTGQTAGDRDTSFVLLDLVVIEGVNQDSYYFLDKGQACGYDRDMTREARAGVKEPRRNSLNGHHLGTRV